MARTKRIYTVDKVAKRIGETLELVNLICDNPDSIPDGELIWIHHGNGEGVSALTELGIECLQELLADIRTWDGGIEAFLRDELCDPDVVERILAHERSRQVP
jgi:hypothetical protein